MENLNQTSRRGFILLHLSDVPHPQIIFFVLFLIIHLMTLSGNVLLINVMWISTNLQTPMYFFLSNLSMIDIGFSSTIVPKILINTLSKDRSISLVGCTHQMYLHTALEAAECIILAVMAYDRSAAICRPLYCQSIINRKMCIFLASIAWGMDFGAASIHTPLTFQFPFFKSHHVQHFFCEMPPFFKISCKDTDLNEIVLYMAVQIIVLFAFFLILISYICIIWTILKTISSQGRGKAFSKCGSHLTVVSMYYGTIIFMCLKACSAYSPEIDRTVSILYTVVTPVLNSVIYSMRNKDDKDTIKIKLCRL